MLVVGAHRAGHRLLAGRKWLRIFVTSFEPRSPLASCRRLVAPHRNRKQLQAGMNNVMGAMSSSTLATLSTMSTLGSAVQCGFTARVTGHGSERRKRWSLVPSRSLA
jgi:hypothetical protein